jgi:hypothetical protein
METQQTIATYSCWSSESNYIILSHAAIHQHVLWKSNEHTSGQPNIVLQLQQINKTLNYTENRYINHSERANQKPL